MSTDLLAALASIVGPAHVVRDPAALEPHLTDWRGRYKGRALALVRPGSAEEVAATVAACRSRSAAIVPQGGNTGVCGGAIPDASGSQVILGLGRMNRVRALDPLNSTMTVDAGCILAEIHRRAEEADRIFPLDLGADGTCQIGGNISTNAGGTGVLRYGNTRDLVLGLEVVLPDGRIWDGLRGLRKDNAGYDLKHLFIGAEGTLGIVTGAVLKLFQKPTATATAFVALPDPEAALRLLERLRRRCGDRLTAFELISEPQLAAVLASIPGTRRPTATSAPWHLLVDTADSGADADLLLLLETALAEAHDAGIALDAAIAKSRAEAKQIWRLRHSVSEANVKTGRVVSHDTSVPVSSIPQFVARCDAVLRERMPEATLHYVGHVGDGNVHVVAIFPRASHADDAAFEAAAKRANALVHDIAHGLGGSIAAEHGVGASLRDRLPTYKAPIEIELMRGIKALLDPLDLMNPGKVVPAPPS